jgi:hypothetical protein
VLPPVGRRDVGDYTDIAARSFYPRFPSLWAEDTLQFVCLFVNLFLSPGERANCLQMSCQVTTSISQDDRHITYNRVDATSENIGQSGLLQTAGEVD